MRFARQRKASGRELVKQGRANRIIYAVFNIVWWAPVVPAFTGTIDYQAGFIGFAAVSTVRLVANLLRNNVLKGENAEYFALRGL